MHMILDCTQWKRLQDQISEALSWFRGKNLLKDHLDSLEKLSGSTLHEVMQIRDRRSYEAFMTGVENPLPLDMVINFANPARPIPFPGVTSDRIRPVLDKLEKDGYVSWEFSLSCCPFSIRKSAGSKRITVSISVPWLMLSPGQVFRR